MPARAARRVPRRSYDRLRYHPEPTFNVFFNRRGNDENNIPGRTASGGERPAQARTKQNERK
jgi:hypothetical protein